ncbi:gamma-glutamyl-gamma-aminobutyrate hydrolase family protein [bacterium]|nr:gamma-glutamyl-gamma-aminobutyrate hydrolase family protein [bacterium]
MKIIGITQRIDNYPSRDEVREALDYRLQLILNKLNFVCVPISAYSSKESLTELFQLFSGFVLSGGNNIGEYPKRDKLEKFILEYSTLRNIPVLGICRGMQFILHHEKFSLVQFENHINTRHKIYFVDNNKSLVVNSFHNFGVLHTSISGPIKSLAYSKDNCSEYIKHKFYPWTGIMWHPERDNKISNFDYSLINEVFNS